VTKERKALKEALNTDSAKRLAVALETSQFMAATREYKHQADLAKKAVLVARKVETVAKNPGAGWLAHSTKHSAKKVSEDESTRRLVAQGSGLMLDKIGHGPSSPKTIQRHTALQRRSSDDEYDMMFAAGVLSGCVTFFAAVSGSQLLSKSPAGADAAVI